LPTVTESDVTPVWSLKAEDGMVDPDPDAVVVGVEEEVDEHAASTTARATETATGTDLLT
jgi:hypothetical protein